MSSLIDLSALLTEAVFLMNAELVGLIQLARCPGDPHPA